jgi:hypothetical protein
MKTPRHHKKTPLGRRNIEQRQSQSNANKSSISIERPQGNITKISIKDRRQTHNVDITENDDTVVRHQVSIALSPMISSRCSATKQSMEMNNYLHEITFDGDDDLVTEVRTKPGEFQQHMQLAYAYDALRNGPSLKLKFTGDY